MMALIDGFTGVAYAVGQVLKTPFYSGHPHPSDLRIFCAQRFPMGGSARNKIPERGITPPPVDGFQLPPALLKTGSQDSSTGDRHVRHSRHLVRNQSLRRRLAEPHHRIPLFSFRTLHIKTNRSIAVNGQGGPERAGPRLHFRRGHIRRLPDKLVWVQPCMVGSLKNGMVMKDYEVSA
jgi:hypothetical protein